MGWLWADPAAKPSTETVNSIKASHAPTALTEDDSPPSTIQAPETQKTKADQASAELELMLQEFQTPTQTQRHASTAGFRSESPSSSSWTPSILYPSTMSCTSTFDQAIYCQIVGGQFVNYYRYGTMRNCSELWSNFWFCMRTNRGFMSDEEREKRIQAFYIAKEARLKKDGSSEDVWEAREEQDVGPWAREQFRWDLRKYERGEAVLRDNSGRDHKGL